MQNNEKESVAVTHEDVEKVISRQNGGVQVKEKSTAKKLHDLKIDLDVNIYGQKRSIERVLKVLRRVSYGLEGEKKPLASFLFCGPSGVGKTQLAKIMTTHLYGSDNLVRLDMSEYSEKFTISQLIGAPPGYVGYYDGGKLTEAVKRQPYSLVLLDEVEKAHPDVYNLLLQVLDEGHITDANGQTVDFRNCVIVMTSNLGNNVPLQVGFKGSEDHMQKTAEKAISKFFRTEFLNRIDDVVYFDSLSDDAFVEILAKEIAEVQTKLALRDIKISLDELVLDKLIKEGSSQKHGARFLRRTLYELVLDPMLMVLEERNIVSRKSINVTLEHDVVCFEVL
jgi:ATP-dependent Clp protease ATP-binding subunit ClpA